MLRKLAVDWAAVSGLSAAVPGGIQLDQNTGTGTPYARCSISTEKEGYTSDQARYAIYAVVVEIFADNATPAAIATLESKMQLLLAASATGTLGGGGGEPTGTVSYAWQRKPTGKSLATPEDRRAGNSVVGKPHGMTIRVQWS